MSILCHQKILFFCVCKYKMVVEITKETWEKCDIKTLIYHNKEEKISELWHKMSHIETQLGHSTVKENQKILQQKNERHYRRKKTK